MSQAPEQRGCFILQPYKNEVFAFMPQDSIIHFRNMTIDYFIISSVQVYFII